MLVRHQEAELMDNPLLDQTEHRNALTGLARINKVSRSASVMLKAIVEFCSVANLSKIRVLDVATGSGDIPLEIENKAKSLSSHLTLNIDGCDISALAIKEANLKAERLGSASRFFVLDALNDEMPTSYDIVINSLFIHHLSMPQIIEFFRRLKHSARYGVIINDLVRSQFNLFVVFLGTRLLSRSSVVHADGVASVKAAFTVEEMQELAKGAGLENAVVTSHFPCRMLLTWRKLANA